MKSKIILIVILLLFQCIIIYSQPNQLKAVLASIGGYATDTQNVLITNLLGEGWAYDYIKSGLLAQGWSNSDITTMKDADATRTNIFNAIDVLPTGLNTTNFSSLEVTETMWVFILIIFQFNHIQTMDSF